MILVRCSRSFSNVLNFSELTAITAPLKNLSLLMKNRTFLARFSAEMCSKEVRCEAVDADTLSAPEAADAMATASLMLVVDAEDSLSLLRTPTAVADEDVDVPDEGRGLLAAEADVAPVMVCTAGLMLTLRNSFFLAEAEAATPF